MTPETWEVVQRLYLEALDRPAAEREEWIAGVSLGQEREEVLGVVRRMLATHDSVASGARRGPVSSAGGGLEGRLLGEFQLIAEIGRGSMGVVYRALQVPLDREVAVKVLAVAKDQRELRTRFRREARIASRLDHVGVVQVLTFGEEEGLLFFAMELVDGWSLGDLLAARDQGTLPPSAPDIGQVETSVAIVRDLARALEHAHELGVLHRDIKPQNILVSRAGIPKLADFGLATAVDLASITISGRVQGTPKYMSPEQALAARARIDNRSDIYSLGVVLYELLSSRLPHEGESPEQLYYSVIHRRPIDLRRREPQVSGGLARVCMRAIRRRREDRYETAGELADDLGRFLRGEVVEAQPQSLPSTIRDHLEDRRTLLKAIPGALALGAAMTGAGAYWFVRSSARRAWPRLRLELLDPDARGRILAQPIGGGISAEWAALSGLAGSREEVELGTFQGRELDVPLPLEDGLWLFVVEDDEGGTAELLRKVERHAVLVGLVRTTKGEDLKGGAVELGTGNHRVLVDRATTTNGEFARFRDAVLARRARGLPSCGWSERLAANQVGHGEREDWDELPVTGVTWQDARACAEWSGKRLLWYGEWKRILSEWGELWQDALDAEELVVRWPERAEDDTEVQAVLQGQADLPSLGTTSGAYRAFVKPADLPLHRGLGVSHPIGNVTEWLGTPAPPFPGHWLTWGGAWHLFSREDDPGRLRSETDLVGELHQRLSVGPSGTSADLGFRCAKTKR